MILGEEGLEEYRQLVEERAMYKERLEALYNYIDFMEIGTAKGYPGTIEMESVKLLTNYKRSINVQKQIDEIELKKVCSYV